MSPPPKTTHIMKLFFRRSFFVFDFFLFFFLPTEAPPFPRSSPDPSMRPGLPPPAFFLTPVSSLSTPSCNPRLTLLKQKNCSSYLTLVLSCVPPPPQVCAFFTPVFHRQAFPPCRTPPFSFRLFSRCAFNGLFFSASGFSCAPNAKRPHGFKVGFCDPPQLYFSLPLSSVLFLRLPP